MSRFRNSNKAALGAMLGALLLGACNASDKDVDTSAFVPTDPNVGYPGAARKVDQGWRIAVVSEAPSAEDVRAND